MGGCVGGGGGGGGCMCVPCRPGAYFDWKGRRRECVSTVVELCLRYTSSHQAKLHGTLPLLKQLLDKLSYSPDEAMETNQQTSSCRTKLVVIVIQQPNNTRTHTHTHIDMQSCNTHLHAYMHTYTYTHAHVHVYTCTRTYTHTHAHTCTRTYTCVSACSHEFNFL